MASSPHPGSTTRPPAPSASNGCRPRPRVALYSHDAMGIGHMRRNLLIARTLAEFPTRANVLLIAGAREMNAFPMPRWVDCLSVPALQKRADGRYHTRSLDLDIGELVRIRSRVIDSALEAFQPDVFIVDKLPRGIMNELDLVLESLSKRGRTKVVLGVRDVLDAPEAVREEWSRLRNEATLRQHYHAVWVYGHRRVHDPLAPCDLAPDVTDRVRYTGYLDPRPSFVPAADPAEGARDPVERLGLPPGPLVLCLMGGGQDGARLALSFVRARPPEGTNGVLLTGPYMTGRLRRQLLRESAWGERLRLLSFIPDPDVLLARASRVIAMGGYNTVCEVLAFEKPALIVPRAKPRLEQLVRAERLRDLGAVEMLHPDDAEPEAISRWLAGPATACSARQLGIDFSGRPRLQRLLAELLAAPPLPALATLDDRSIARAAS